MPDYQSMYLTLFRATEEAINLLTAAQQAVEEQYINSEDPLLTVLEKKTESGCGE